MSHQGGVGGGGQKCAKQVFEWPQTHIYMKIEWLQSECSIVWGGKEKWVKLIKRVN